MKTLHPKVHGGLLAARGNAGHEAETGCLGCGQGFFVAVLGLNRFAWFLYKGFMGFILELFEASQHDVYVFGCCLPMSCDLAKTTLALQLREEAQHAS